MSPVGEEEVVVMNWLLGLKEEEDKSGRYKP
jgi:hypothetical protein